MVLNHKSQNFQYLFGKSCSNQRKATKHFGRKVDLRSQNGESFVVFTDVCCCTFGCV